MAPKRQPAATVRSRVVGHGEERAADLLANPFNHRRHPPGQREVIRGSLDELGWLKSVIVNRTTGHVVDGHARVEDALGRGDDALVPVEYVELSEAEEKLALAVLDASSELATTDKEALSALLAETEAGDAALQAFLRELAGAAVAPTSGLRPGVDPDDVPAPPRDPVSRLGDVVTLGAHRLICGDATLASTWQQLLGGASADLLWTDPPYGVSYVGKTEEKLTIENDELSLEALEAFLGAALAPAVAALRPGSPVYVAGPSGPMGLAFMHVLARLKVWRQTLLWVKDRFVLGRADYHQQHEALYVGREDSWPLDPAPQGDREAIADLQGSATKEAELMLYGWRPGAAHRWRGGRTLSTVLEVPRPASSREHPTMKPTALISRCLLASSDPGALVIDPFAGSGSTMMACEMNGRRCFGIELDPRFVDVHIDRWQAATGQAAVVQRLG